MSDIDTERGLRIVVAGDAAVDWFFFPMPACDSGHNWRLRPATHAAALPGGVLLLTEMLREAAHGAALNADIDAPEPPAKLEDVSPEELLHSNAMLTKFPRGDRDPSTGKAIETLRIRESHGYIGPVKGHAKAQAPKRNFDEADVIVLNDPGNGFRDEPSAWPKALSASNAPLVVHKLHRPLDTGPLWDRIRSAHSERHVLVVLADDLRCIPGVDVSEALSWERTAKDLAFQMLRAEPLEALRSCPYLVTLFGSDGAIVRYGRERAQATLIFDPASLEGDYAASVAGEMHGQTSAFVAALTTRLARDGLAGLEAGVRDGLAAMREFLRRGFDKSNGVLGYPLTNLFDAKDSTRLRSCAVPPAESLTDPDPHFWRILDQRTRNTRTAVADEIVRDGSSAGLASTPVGSFGKLRTIDRAEIESYSAIGGLIREFLANPKPSRPLSFAVFGPPGSGKSFGVNQVVASLGASDLQPIEFNISQFSGYGDLVAAFHQVRNVGLRGRVPFVFFDEFDAAGSDGPLGWLKSFLAPMQDGEFKEAGAVHPIGKAILVFAGGTRSTFEEFAGEASADRTEAAVANEREFKAAKGPDFVSRLRGFINVMGPNRQHPVDDAFLIRRAMVLRNMLERNAKAKGMFDNHERLRIDDGVLRALLHVGRYRHGMRSMEAVLDMSRLAGRDRFDLAALPPTDQLNLHVDAEEFEFLSQQERFVSLLPSIGRSDSLGTCIVDGETRKSAIAVERKLVDAAAQRIHEAYVRQRKLENKSDASVVEWEQLSESKRRSNQDAAADVPRKLRAIGHGVRPIPSGRKPLTPDITDDEVARMARMEHARWCTDQRLQGYTFGPNRDPVRRTSPYLIPYEALPDDVRRYDVQSVMQIPALLRDLGFETYRMEESETLDDPDLVERLARQIHADYVKKRRREGDTLETNKSIADFDALAADVRETNFDNAASIPRKLKRLGYDLCRVPHGSEPTRLALTDDEIEALAIMEHARWNWQRILQGWTFAPGKKDEEKLTSPCLVPWAELTYEIQDYDRQTVRLIPDLLYQTGYEAHPARSN